MRRKTPVERAHDIARPGRRALYIRRDRPPIDDLARLCTQTRLALRETQTEFGRRLGVSKTAVAKWETGANAVTPARYALLVRLARTHLKE